MNLREAFSFTLQPSDDPLADDKALTENMTLQCSVFQALQKRIHYHFIRFPQEIVAPKWDHFDEPQVRMRQDGYDPDLLLFTPYGLALFVSTSAHLLSQSDRFRVGVLDVFWSAHIPQTTSVWLIDTKALGIFKDNQFIIRHEKAAFEVRYSFKVPSSKDSREYVSK